MESNARDILLCSWLIDLHRRKTEAELSGLSTKAYEALIELYELELTEIEEARLEPSADKPEAA